MQWLSREWAARDVSLTVTYTEEVTIVQLNLHHVGKLYIQPPVTHWTGCAIRVSLDGEDVSFHSLLAPERFPESVMKDKTRVVWEGEHFFG